MKATIINEPSIYIVQRILSKTSTENECWVYNGYIDRCGYARTGLNGKNRLAHRVIYLAANGTLSPSLELDHLCRNRKCINPAHLEEVTPYENSKRGNVWLLNKHKTNCPKGHLYDSTNTRFRKKDGARECRACDRSRRRIAA